MYYDGQMNGTRFNLLIVLTAMQKGAVGANYVEVRIGGCCRLLYLSTTLYFFSSPLVSCRSNPFPTAQMGGSTARLSATPRTLVAPSPSERRPLSTRRVCLGMRSESWTMQPQSHSSRGRRCVIVVVLCVLRLWS